MHPGFTCRKRSDEDTAGPSKGKKKVKPTKRKKTPKNKKTPLKKKQKKDASAPPPKVVKSLRDLLADG
jgi:hypothetical protein